MRTLVAIVTLAAVSIVATPAAARTTSRYADAIRESVWVDTPLDNDADGRPDRVAVDLVRPRTAARVPVIMVASPYYQCCGRGLESEVKQYAADGTVTKFPLFYDNYFVPRGYAFAAVDAAGTSRSTGCADVGGREEILAVKAAIDWLNGRAPGFRADGTRAAAGWSTGKVGMIGKSWDGSIANGVAATGVRGLETIVPISAISSWYDYSRFNGVVRSTGHHVYLHDLINGRPEGVCDGVRAKLATGSDDATGAYNAYWDERNFRPDADKVRASVFVVHGINDYNVTTRQFASWWAALGAHRVPRKIWLYQQAHTDPFDVRRAEWVDTLHRWFDYWLKGVDNGIMREPQATVERTPGQWAEERSWPAPTIPQRARLGSGRATFVDNPELTEEDLATDPNAAKDGRLVFLSEPLRKPVRISGASSVTLRITVDKPATNLSVRLVDYGVADRVNYFDQYGGVIKQEHESCWGESTADDDACYFDTVEDLVSSDHAVLTRGWLKTSHRPGGWYSATVPLQPHDATLAPGHILGVVVSQSDTDFTSPTPSGATVQVDLAGSRLTLPATGAIRIAAPGAAPLVAATESRRAVTDHHTVVP
jgi:X-Pro dipeptidyl-peptidase